MVPITARDRKALVALIENYGDKALRAVGLAHRDIPAAEVSARTHLLAPEELEHDLVLDAIVVRKPFKLSSLSRKSSNKIKKNDAAV